MKKTAALPAWQIHPQARLRRTPGGGAVFLPETVTTVELDAEAFSTLLLLGSPRSARQLRPFLAKEFQRNFTLAQIDVLLCELAKRNVLARSDAVVSQRPVRTLAAQAAPESIHLQLNDTCNLRCPSCYVALSREETQGTLPLERIGQLLEEWAQMGVFQLALGGGEPLLSAQFVPVVRWARQRDIVPNATTNGWPITETLLDQVQGSLGELRLSLNDAASMDLPLLESKAALLRARDMRFGFNLIVTRRNLERLASVLFWACEQGAGTVNLIRPKPALENQDWYEANRLRESDVRHLSRVLEKSESLFTHTVLSLDCAFSFLFQGQPAGALAALGVAGCALGERFATVKSNGDVYPCSHLRGKRFHAGNVMARSFREVWEESEVLRQICRAWAGNAVAAPTTHFARGVARSRSTTSAIGWRPIRFAAE